MQDGNLAEVREERELEVSSHEEDYTEYFRELHKAALVYRRDQIKKNVLEHDRRRKRKLQGNGGEKDTTV